MAGDLHLELDALRDALWDRSELSSPLVFVSYGEPPEHVRALMRTLGVRVEVQPMSRDQTNATGTVTAHSLAAQDYRASIANVFKREQNGDAALTCESCGTETDATAIAHSPSCDRYVPPAAPEKKGGGEGTSWETDRNGRRRSTRERNAAGELSSGEMQRRHEAVLDSHPTITSCGLEGCGWRFEGTAAESRDAAAAHRAEQHPDVGKSKRSRFPKPGQSNVQAGLALEQGRAALEAMDAGEPQPKADTPMDIPAPDTASAGSTPASTRGGKWTRATIVDAIKAWAHEHGRPPTTADWLAKDPAGKRPTASAAIKTHGPWSSLLTDAGFAARRGGRRAIKVSEPEPLAQEPPAPSPQDEAETRLTSSPARHTRGLVFALITAGRAFLDVLERELG